MAAPTINNTLASEVSNSYVDVPYADDFWAQDYRSSYSTQWSGLSATQKINLLIKACKVIETARYCIPVTLPEYALHYDRRTGKVLSLNLTRQPVKYYFYQRLQFPRNLDVYFQNPPVGFTLGQIYLPEDVLIAQCEQALYLLNFDESAMASQIQGISMEKTALGKGNLDVTTEYTNRPSMFSPSAMELLRPYMVGGGKIQRA